jgi:hypothetical protein
MGDRARYAVDQCMKAAEALDAARGTPEIVDAREACDQGVLYELIRAYIDRDSASTSSAPQALDGSGFLPRLRRNRSVLAGLPRYLLGSEELYNVLHLFLRR